MDKKIGAVIFGATGTIGSGVLNECLKHPLVEKVTSISRKSSGKVHEKLTEIIHSNFLDLSSIEEGLKDHNACFYCLGVSQLQVSEEKKYHEITYDYTMAAAKTLTRINEKISFCFLSGLGTDPTMKSRYMWARIKGETEKDLETVPFHKLFHFRPGFVFPKSGIKHSLTTTKIMKPFYPFLYSVFPKFVANTEELGLAMINAVLSETDKKVFENKDLRKIANQ
ncbi:NAD-dependent epimerase/dehydratase family protein [Bacteroidota bacterium]